MSLLQRGRTLWSRLIKCQPEHSPPYSTPVTIISSERCFDTILNIPEEEDASVPDISESTYAHVYIRLLGTLGIIPFQECSRRKTSPGKIGKLLRKVILHGYIIKINSLLLSAYCIM